MLTFIAQHLCMGPRPRTVHVDRHMFLSQSVHLQLSVPVFLHPSAFPHLFIHPCLLDYVSSVSCPHLPLVCPFFLLGRKTRRWRQEGGSFEASARLREEGLPAVPGAGPRGALYAILWCLC